MFPKPNQVVFFYLFKAKQSASDPVRMPLIRCYGNGHVVSGTLINVVSGVASNRPIPCTQCLNS